jgi:predicted ATPase
VWGRNIEVPRASGDAAMFTFDELIGKATGAADYIELCRTYHGFVITGVPGMTYRERDLARRFITFIDAVYESRVSHCTWGVKAWSLISTTGQACIDNCSPPLPTVHVA